MFVQIGCSCSCLRPLSWSCHGGAQGLCTTVNSNCPGLEGLLPIWFCRGAGCVCLTFAYCLWPALSIEFDEPLGHEPESLHGRGGPLSLQNLSVSQITPPPLNVPHLPGSALLPIKVSQGASCCASSSSYIGLVSPYSISCQSLFMLCLQVLVVSLCIFLMYCLTPNLPLLAMPVGPFRQPVHLFWCHWLAPDPPNPLCLQVFLLPLADT